VSLVIAAAQSSSIPGDVLSNVARHVEFGTIAAESGVQLLVFPELSLTGYEPKLARACAVRYDSSDPDPLQSFAPLQRLANDAGMIIVAGAPLLGEEGELYIGAMIIRPHAPVSLHTKVHLHPGEEAVFTPGPGGPVIEAGGTSVALAICADTNHPEHAANAASQGARVYASGVLLTDEGYAPDTELLKGYAVRHRMVILMANHSGESGGYVSAGKSAIWSEDGSPIAASKGSEDALVIASRRDDAWGSVVLPGPPPSRGAYA
jgi:predicted amidohydrolase